MQLRREPILSPSEWEELFESAPILRLIGKTPLVRIPLDDLEGIRLYAKLEGMNPGGSVKDRPALYMVAAALKARELVPGKVLLDSSSGNTGIAYAMIGAALGFPVRLCLPENASEERKQLIRAYGAEIHLTDPMEGSEGARVVAREMYEREPEKYFLPDQYNNVNNPQAHFETTGPEIWEATGGEVTHFLAGIGTSGTLMGTGRYLKQRDPRIKVYAVEPDNPFHGLEGLKHMATAMVPGIYDPSWLDGVIPVATEDAYREVGRLARMGILVGASSGAAMAAARRLAREVKEGVIVTVFPDGGGRYLSTGLHEFAQSM